ncbi:hypothetical protein AB0F91_21545 [Amycolatopsis sp. NPDC023774]|uniref:hypothetical protein n=1 Tax=Amycolatopsis sp. NPDC023774 TaxID=3155015 RepID=UPI00340FB4A5
MRPDGDSVSAAARLLTDEHQRLSQAKLFYVTEDITKLVLHAARSVKDHWDVRLHDVPSLTGFIHFGHPMAEYVRDDGAVVRIVAMSWGPTDLMNSPDAGLWLSFWSVTDYPSAEAYLRNLGAGRAEAPRLARVQHAELTWDNEIYLPWGKSEATLHASGVRLADPSKMSAAKTTLDWLPVVIAAWLFCLPNSFTEVDEAHLPRSLRRRAERAGVDTSPVRVVSVSRKPRALTVSRSTGESGRTLGVQFPVSPFVRWQACGPGWQDRRRRIGAGRWRGPVDAPVRIGKTVTWSTRPSTVEKKTRPRAAGWGRPVTGSPSSRWRRTQPCKGIVRGGLPRGR